jgi:UDP-glucose 4-epimerase
MANILVTGPDGFIGRHVVPTLLGAGHRVVAARKRAGTIPGLPADVSILTVGDLATARLGPALREIDIVVHLAGRAHVMPGAVADERLFISSNVTATERLAAAAREAGVGAFINMSSIAATTSNVRGQPVDDTTPPAPDTAYGCSKLAAEKTVVSLALADCFALSLRPPMVIGADAPGNWASLQRLAATGLPLPFASIQARRSFISVQTLVEAIALLCNRPWPSELSGAYCIADPEPLALPEIVRELRRGLGRAPRLLPCPPAALDLLGVATGQRRRMAALTGPLEVDGSRFAKTFGFSPSLPLREAIALSGKTFAASRRQNGAAALPLRP